ncbi:hypothetical protein J5K46_005282 [Salmonella enterica subsp. enterica serovar Java]|nr:hypothetical protein [Salmonella enterica subsp. enterica serovar Java]
MFPAPVGINRDRNSQDHPGKCVPRASGDKPIADLLNAIKDGCSPRQRG